MFELVFSYRTMCTEDKGTNTHIQKVYLQLICLSLSLWTFYLSRLRKQKLRPYMTSSRLCICLDDKRQRDKSSHCYQEIQVISKLLVIKFMIPKTGWLRRILCVCLCELFHTTLNGIGMPSCTNYRALSHAAHTHTQTHTLTGTDTHMCAYIKQRP